MKTSVHKQGNRATSENTCTELPTSPVRRDPLASGGRSSGKRRRRPELSSGLRSGGTPAAPATARPGLSAAPAPRPAPAAASRHRSPLSPAPPPPARRALRAGPRQLRERSGLRCPTARPRPQLPRARRAGPTSAFPRSNTPRNSARARSAPLRPLLRPAPPLAPSPLRPRPRRGGSLRGGAVSGQRSGPPGGVAVALVRSSVRALLPRPGPAGSHRRLTTGIPRAQALRKLALRQWQTCLVVYQLTQAAPAHQVVHGGFTAAGCPRCSAVHGPYVL